MTESAQDRATSIGSSHLQTDPEDDVRWEAVRPRSLSLAQWDRFESYVREIFEALGMDLETPGTKDTPSRFLRALLDSTDGYEGDPKLLKTFPTECRGGPDCRISQIVEGPISFFALCEHHALPFYGVAHIATSPTRTSSASPSSRGWCACSGDASRCRNASVSRSPTLSCS